MMMMMMMMMLMLLLLLLLVMLVVVVVVVMVMVMVMVMVVERLPRFNFFRELLFLGENLTLDGVSFLSCSRKTVTHDDEMWLQVLVIVVPYSFWGSFENDRAEMKGPDIAQSHFSPRPKKTKVSKKSRSKISKRIWKQKDMCFFNVYIPCRFMAFFSPAKISTKAAIYPMTSGVSMSASWRPSTSQSLGLDDGKLSHKWNMFVSNPVFFIRKFGKSVN